MVAIEVYRRAGGDLRIESEAGWAEVWQVRHLGLDFVGVRVWRAGQRLASLVSPRQTVAEAVELARRVLSR